VGCVRNPKESKSLVARRIRSIGFQRSVTVSLCPDRKLGGITMNAIEPT
jgi:hypothetical protein